MFLILPLKTILKKLNGENLNNNDKEYKDANKYFKVQDNYMLYHPIYANRNKI